MTSLSEDRGRCLKGGCFYSSLSVAAVQAKVGETAKKGTFSFHAVAACIKATRWWQCCCGQNEIPPAVSASSLELHALMQSWLTE